MTGITGSARRNLSAAVGHPNRWSKIHRRSFALLTVNAFGRGLLAAHREANSSRSPCFSFQVEVDCPAPRDCPRHMHGPERCTDRVWLPGLPGFRSGMKLASSTVRQLPRAGGGSPGLIDSPAFFRLQEKHKTNALPGHRRWTADHHGPRRLGCLHTALPSSLTS
jgi:hypothetical protein